MQRRTKRTSRARSAGDRPGKVKQLRRGRHLGVAALVVEADAERAPADVQAELVGEVEHAPVGGGDRVVEAIDPDTAELRAAGQAAERRRRLVDADRHAARGELVREPEAEQAAADDADAAHGLALATAWRAMTRA